MVSSDTEIPNSTPPPLSILVVLSIFITSIASLPYVLASIDEVATVETCTISLFPEIISRLMLGWIRVGFAVFIFIVSAKWSTEKMYLTTNYMKQSKLKAEPMLIGGIKSQMSFTSWSWNLLGLFFTISGGLTLLVEYHGGEDNYDILMNSTSVRWALRLCILLFEVAAPTSMLVSAVVTYVLWPKALTGNGTDNLKQPAALLQHNANIIMSLIELGLLGGLPVRLVDMAVAPLFGVVYVVFAWSIRFTWVPSGQPQFLYFFMDTTLGNTSTWALIILLMTLVVFYTLFMVMDQVFVMLDGGFWTHVALVIGISASVCRFRD